MCMLLLVFLLLKDSCYLRMFSNTDTILQFWIKWMDCTILVFETVACVGMRGSPQFKICMAWKLNQIIVLYISV